MPGYHVRLIYPPTSPGHLCERSQCSLLKFCNNLAHLHLISKSLITNRSQIASMEWAGNVIPPNPCVSIRGYLLDAYPTVTCPYPCRAPYSLHRSLSMLKKTPWIPAEGSTSPEMNSMFHIPVHSVNSSIGRFLSTCGSGKHPEEITGRSHHCVIIVCGCMAFTLRICIHVITFYSRSSPCSSS